MTPSAMMALGTPGPDFALPEPLTGKVHRRDGLLRLHGLLVAFICNHCPYVKHINPELVRTSQWALDHNIGVVFISSNDATAHPADGPKAMAEQARTQRYPVPYLYDETQDVAKAYGAACTPSTAPRPATKCRSPATSCAQPCRRCTTGNRPPQTRNRASAATSSGVERGRSGVQAFRRSGVQATFDDGHALRPTGLRRTRRTFGRRV